MARHLGPVCRLCRREGIKLMLKGARCDSAKCPMERQWRSMPPGMQSFRRGGRRGKTSQYGLRLREKQKVKRYYGVWERQFMLYFRRAERARENTGMALLRLLERRLDNVVHTLGMAPSRKAARVAIVHGHLHVNGRKVDRPSFLVRVNDKITVKPSDKSQKLVKQQVGEDGGGPVPAWLSLNADQLEATVLALPTRDDVRIPIEEQLIVEMCSR